MALTGRAAVAAVRIARRVVLSLLCGLLLATTARAETEGSGDDAVAPDHVAPPVPIGSIEVPWPEGATPPSSPVEVEVALQIDETGQVVEVRLLRGAGPPWDEAVIEAARTFRFEPARWGDQPVAVEVPFLQRFAPPPVDDESEDEQAADPILEAAIEGEVIEMGSRLPVPSPVVLASIGDGRYRTEGDGTGRFSLRIPAGTAEVEVVVPGYLRFVVTEELAAGQKLQVRYLVQRISHHPFEQTVIGKPTRQEVTRTTLRERELHRVPGTFGDPFRVISTMPGVGQIFSLLDYPIIRGASPGSSGILLDGDPIPQLFHFLAGPAVIHPSFIDRIDFYPGAFPLTYGGYTGGIVDGITRERRQEDPSVEVGADLMKSSLLLRQEVGGTQATVAGRYGYPGMLLGLANDDAFMSYWDYQARLDGRAGGGRWTVFAYGSFDEFGEIRDGQRNTALQTLFHRLSLRWSEGDPTSFDRYELGLGLDRSRTGSEPVDDAELVETGAGYTLGEWMIHPRARWRRPLTENLALHGGLGLQWRRTGSTFSIEDQEEDLLPPTWTLRTGAFLEAPWWITRDLLLVPGTRFDHWETEDVRRFSIDPRVNLRWRASEAERSELWLKAGVGIFHQPPRPPVPIPGLTALLLEEGLPAALQTTLGAELDLESGWFFDVQTYFNFMEPIFLDLEVNGTNSSDMEGYADAYSSGLTGRSFGVEVLLRRQAVGNVFGWVSYTLSRSERLAPDGWKAFDFDRTHMLQFVGSLRLPRDWELGSRLQLASGRPVNPWGEATERASLFARLDFRIDRRVVYRSWMLDFYVELINVTIAREQVAEGSDSAIPYIFPTVGFRAIL